MQMIDPDTPIWQLTVFQFIQLIEKHMRIAVTPNPEKRYVYGIDGIADLFNCSRSKAVRLKQSGIIDAAIKQNGRTIIIDADLAIKLFGQ